jgi:hypothetical protein
MTGFLRADKSGEVIHFVPGSTGFRIGGASAAKSESEMHKQQEGMKPIRKKVFIMFDLERDKVDGILMVLFGIVAQPHRGA